MKKISLIVLAILLIPAMGWGFDAIPQYEFKYVTYSETGSLCDKAKDMELITMYRNQALRENPGWSLVHFFRNTLIRPNSDIPRKVLYEFEIIIYLQREVGE